MFWKSANSQPGSIALRLTLWYSIAAFLLVLGAIVYLYFGLKQTLDVEDDQFLLERARAIERILQQRPIQPSAILQEVTAAGADRHAGRLYVRVILDGSPTQNFETVGMSDLISQEQFPPLESGQREWIANTTTESGISLRLRIRRTEDNHLIQIAMNRSGDDEILEEFRNRLAVALTSSLILAILGGFWIARRGLRPLTDVTQTAQKIGPSNLSERIPLTGRPLEVRTLAETFNRMLDRLEEAFSRLDRFTADIAHELRTPVNALRSEMEVALSRVRSIGEYESTLGSCLDECDRLTRLINSLLLLARAEHPQRERILEEVEIAQELSIAAEFYEATATEKGIRLEVEADGSFPLQADRTLIQQSIGNLLANALAHTPRGGTIRLFANRTDAEISFGVADSGNGIASEHLPMIFERFYRGDSTQPGGLGIGLAIVRAIAILHGGRVQAANLNPRGTQVW